MSSVGKGGGSVMLTAGGRLNAFVLRSGEDCGRSVSRIERDGLNDLSVSRFARGSIGGQPTSLSLSASLSRAGRRPLGGRDFTGVVTRVPRGALTGRSSPMSWFRLGRGPLEGRE